MNLFALYNVLSYLCIWSVDCVIEDDGPCFMTCEEKKKRDQSNIVGAAKQTRKRI